MPDRAGFLLAEDQALKAKFSGIQLVDDRDTDLFICSQK